MKKILCFLLLSAFATNALAAPGSFALSFVDELGDGSHLVQLGTYSPIWLTPSSGTMSPNQPFSAQAVYRGPNVGLNDTILVGVGTIDGQQFIQLVPIKDLSTERLNVCHVTPNSISGFDIKCGTL